jgi:hypothetical protein
MGVTAATSRHYLDKVSGDYLPGTPKQHVDGAFEVLEG